MLRAARPGPRVPCSRGLVRTNFSQENSRGFTLIELLVAVGIFMVILVVAVGGLLSLMQANYKAQTLKTVVNNLHFAFENMSRNLRTGSRYHCDVAQGDIGAPRDCAQSPASSIALRAYDGSLMRYRQNGAVIERAVQPILPDGSVDSNLAYIPITAPEIRIERLQFFVDGSSLTDKRQPRVLIVSSGTMQGKGKVLSQFNLETLLSQRYLNTGR